MADPIIIKRLVKQDIEDGAFNDFEVFINSSASEATADGFRIWVVGVACLLETADESGIEVNIKKEPGMVNGLLMLKNISIKAPATDSLCLWYIEITVNLESFLSVVDVNLDNNSSKPQRRKGGRTMVQISA